jgi:hypothetical protein
MPPFVLDYYKQEHIAQVRVFTLGLAIKVLTLVTSKKNRFSPQLDTAIAF